jgi:hypothetical protein
LREKPDAAAALALLATDVKKDFDLHAGLVYLIRAGVSPNAIRMHIGSSREGIN